MKRRLSILLFLILASLAGSTFFAQSILPTKKTQNKVSNDTISKKNNLLLPKEISADSVIQFQGRFKPFKKSAHASYYADKFHGRRTASGRVYDKTKLTAAHKSLAFGTKVKVTNESNGKSVVVEITDRGPYVRGREIDLSRKAFYSIATSSGAGFIKVTLEVLQK